MTLGQFDFPILPGARVFQPGGKQRRSFQIRFEEMHKQIVKSRINLLIQKEIAYFITERWHFARF